MRRAELQHLIRAATTILDTGEVMVIGSQAILASYRDAALPDELVSSMEADLLPTSGSESDADLIDGNLGEASPFHQTFGVYGDGVGLETATLPDGWQERLVPLLDPASGRIGWCLEPHDLCVAKSIAGRPKDVEFVTVAVTNRLVDPMLIRERLETVDHVATKRAIALMLRLEPDGIPAADRDRWRQRRRKALEALLQNVEPGTSCPTPLE